jgi:mannitol/fructose-specific phosphotransferase system IIA component (Ntr-type)
MAIGKPAEPIDFESIDGKPVNIIILLVSPIDQTGPHIQALAHISRMMTNDAFRAAVRDADDPQQIYQLIEEHEKELTPR